MTTTPDVSVAQDQSQSDIVARASVMSTVQEQLIGCQGENHVVIDLGTINHFVLDTLSSHDCVYATFKFQERINAEIDANEKLNSERFDIEFLKDDIDRIFRACRHGMISMVFTWDLLNYISQKSIMQIMSKLTPFCRPDTLLHSLLWSNQQVPRRPDKFDITEDWELEHYAQDNEFDKVHSYTAQRIRSLIPSFEIMRLTVADSGLQDTLFKFTHIADSPDPELITIESTYPFYDEEQE